MNSRIKRLEKAFHEMMPSKFPRIVLSYYDDEARLCSVEKHEIISESMQKLMHREQVCLIVIPRELVDFDDKMQSVNLTEFPDSENFDPNNLSPCGLIAKKRL